MVLVSSGTSWLMVALVAVLPAADNTTPCSSLDGPRCPWINDKSLTTRPAASDANRGSWRERLVEVVQKHLRDSVKERPTLGGSFEIGGPLPDAEGKFDLKPGDWLDQPAGWITVGLVGQFEDNITLSGFITDPTSGEVMSACSRFALQRRLDNAEFVEAHYLGGTWQGVYICAGTVTRLVLTLQPDHNAFASGVVGTFDFHVLNELNSDELHELTRLVSESLLDIGGLDSDVQLYVVDPSTGLIQPIDSVIDEYEEDHEEEDHDDPS